MSESKNEILGRIREALSDRPTPPQVERTYRRTSELSREQAVEMLVDRLVDYKANVHHENLDTVAERVGELLGEGTYVVPSGLDSGWLPADTDARRRAVEPAVGEGEPFDVRTLDSFAAVVTSSTASCAETGTIFLTGRPEEGRRAISLVPDHHVCIVPLDSVVELFPEALARVEPTSVVTMISGPSATSDIELERVEGVHGPRTLDVILLDTGSSEG